MKKTSYQKQSQSVNVKKKTNTKIEKIFRTFAFVRFGTQMDLICHNNFVRLHSGLEKPKIVRFIQKTF